MIFHSYVSLLVMFHDFPPIKHGNLWKSVRHPFRPCRTSPWHGPCKTRMEWVWCDDLRDNGKSAIYSCFFPLKAIKTSIYSGCSRIFYMICPSTVIYRLFRQQLNSWASKFCVTAMFETEGTEYQQKTEKVQWNSVFRDWNCWPSIFLGGVAFYIQTIWTLIISVGLHELFYSRYLDVCNPQTFMGKLRAGLLNLRALGQCPTFIWISLIQIWLPLVGMLVIQY